MKRYSALVALVVALVFGALAVIFANKWLAAHTSRQVKAAPESVPVTRIVVTTKDLPIGSLLDKSNLALVEWPKGSIPKGAFFDIGKLEKRVAVTKLSAGEPVLAAELAAPGSAAGLVALIPPGMRAMAVKVDEVSGVAGFVLPDSYVDVIGVRTLPGRGHKQIAKTILKRIKVLAIAQETFTEQGKAKIVKTVTLQVKPRQAEKLALQTHEGPIHLVLRNPTEKERQPLPVVRRVAKKRAVPVLRPRVYVPRSSPFGVEIIRRSQRQEVRFKNAHSDDRL
jgi:pilus assembly protein CpaB